MQLPNLGDVLNARSRIAATLRLTPVLDDPRLNAALGATVYVKAEHLQRTGCFKFRGIFHKVASLSDQQRANGLVTMSSGNAAQALAMAARYFDCPCTVVTFPDTVAAKLAPIRALDADIVFGGNTVDELYAACQTLVAERGLAFVHPFDDPDVIAGHGSLALELHDAVDTLDAVLVPTSGGGLLSATALVYKHIAPDTKIYGVQPADACGIYKSVATGKIVAHPPRTIADGLRAHQPGACNFALIERHADGILLVPDEHIPPAMALIWDTLRTAIEPSAAVCIAFLMAEKQRFSGMKVGVVTTGCNVDLSQLQTAYQAFRAE